jgi:3-isopropylmalate/(R)-2-methylmalate dehydratase small subunit
MSAFEPFTSLTAIAAPLLKDNVDTDAIIPSREMKSTGKTGLATAFSPAGDIRSPAAARRARISC